MIRVGDDVRRWDERRMRNTIKVNQVNIIKENRGTNWINSIFSSFLEEEGRCLEKIRDYINLTQFNLIIRSGNTCNVFLAAILKKKFDRNFLFAKSIGFFFSLSFSLTHTLIHTHTQMPLSPSYTFKRYYDFALLHNERLILASRFNARSVQKKKVHLRMRDESIVSTTH